MTFPIGKRPNEAGCSAKVEIQILDEFETNLRYISEAEGLYRVVHLVSEHCL